MPNMLAYGILLAWPLFCLIALRKRPAEQALLIAVLGGYLLLPKGVEFDLSGLPDYNKSIAIILGALFATRLKDRASAKLLPDNGLIKLCLAFAVITPILSVLSNMTADGPAGSVVEPLKTWDMISYTFENIVEVFPFVLGFMVLGTRSSHYNFMRYLLLGASLYAILVVIELQLSPQINIWVYGYFQHNFAQHVRGGGYRPIVFLDHALVLGMFLVMASVAAASLRQTSEKFFWLPSKFATPFFTVLLIFTKSLGPIMLGLGALFTMFRRRNNLAIALIFCAALLASFYPFVRATGIIPIADMTERLAEIAPERAHSFNFRVQNEEVLLQRVAEKPMVGWGAIGRITTTSIYGKVENTFDGRWIITLSQFGWFGYLSLFGLIIVPMLAIVRIHRRGTLLAPQTLGLGLICAVSLIDLLPNSSLSPLVLLAAGGLMGFVSYGKDMADKEDQENRQAATEIAKAALARA